MKPKFAFAKSLVTGALLFLAGMLVAPTATAQQQSLLEYPSIHSPRVGLHGMAVSQSELASNVGARVLAEGGNAVDAATAIAFTLAVTLPRAGNLGGDGFMLLGRAIGKVARLSGVVDGGYRIIANNGANGHQEVPHLHFHVLGGRPLGRMLAKD